MIRISKLERDALDAVGLIRYRKVKNGKITDDATLKVCNREHVGKNVKTYYVTESFEVLAFLGKLEGLNLQKINSYQMRQLEKTGYVTEANKQYFGTYVPDAVVYQDENLEWWAKKNPKMLIDAGIWKERPLNYYNNKRNKNIDSPVGSYGQSMEEIALAEDDE